MDARKSNLTKETELIRRLQSGDKEALSQIYFLYWESFYDTAVYLLKNTHQAEDVVHDVFLAFWNARKRITVQTSLKGYLSQSVRYECYRLLKERNRYIDSEYHQKEYSTDSDLQKLEAEELTAQVRTILSKMPSKSQKIFQLSREKELTYNEIARKMGLTTKAVEYHISKVLRALRKAIYIILILFLG